MEHLPFQRRRRWCRVRNQHVKVVVKSCLFARLRELPIAFSVGSCIRQATRRAGTPLMIPRSAYHMRHAWFAVHELWHPRYIPRTALRAAYAYGPALLDEPRFGGLIIRKPLRQSLPGDAFAAVIAGSSYHTLLLPEAGDSTSGGWAAVSRRGAPQHLGWQRADCPAAGVSDARMSVAGAKSAPARVRSRFRGIGTGPAPTDQGIGRRYRRISDDSERNCGSSTSAVGTGGAHAPGRILGRRPADGIVRCRPFRRHQAPQNTRTFSILTACSHPAQSSITFA